MQRPLGAQISHMLKARGVDVIFGIPGVHNQEMYRGIEEAGITHVLARHEQGAGFMADGYARATGRPGVAYVITGPGLCNIMTPMGQAYSDSVPVLVISSCLGDTVSEQGQLHQMRDQEAAAATVSDWSETARTPHAAYQLIDRALAEFQLDRPRTKHISVTIPALEAQAPPPPLVPVTTIGKPYIRQTELHECARLLTRARQPLIIVGGGHRGSGIMIERVAEQTGAAIFTTYAGRGLIRDDHPLYFGASLARSSSADIIAQADLVLAAGTELAEVDLWRKDLGHDCPMIRVDLDQTVLSDRHGASYRYKVDASQFFAALQHETKDATPAVRWRADAVAAQRAAWRAEVEVERPGIASVCDALRAALPDKTMIYSDMTQFAYTAKEVWPMAHPHHWHHPSGFGTLGYAVPAAIGGAVARRDRPTLAIIGDYGFHYTMAELGVAVELGLPLPIILWDNGKLKEIEDSMTRAQIAPNAVIARNPDFCKLAEAFGAYTAAPASLQEMQEAVRTAFAADGPTLIYLTPGIMERAAPSAAHAPSSG
ncbi:5-guanidino-2-oxopentanoate decarboxylase [Tateyamaria sp. SN6-1]|uniref:5-guanidino-2-oxopentanoate decarboxylase n=1 Tax=Tateyamaria sp. SN6-1 TaxID=3092148 RepID=UPI0039F53537